jgi:hypothetical protein
MMHLTIGEILLDGTKAEGRRQKEENIIFLLCQKALKPLNLFMGFPFCPLPPAFSKGKWK